jgi:aminoglycoside phosphotransferase (APT) family kinase protein
MTTLPPPFEQIAQKIVPQSQLIRTWQLKGGLSAQMTALEILLPDGQTQKMIVRQLRDRTLNDNPRAAADQFKLLQLIQSIGVAAQTPHYLDESGEIFPAPYLVIEYIEGQPDFTPTDLSDYARQIASQLAKIHSLDSSKLDLSFLPKQAQQVIECPANIDKTSDEWRIREALASIGDVPQSNRLTLLHGDFWPGNLLWRDGQLAAVIDWEDAVIGDPLKDFAISRLDTLIFFGVNTLHEFTRHYQAASTLDFRHLPYWDLCAALRAAPNLAEWGNVDPQFGRPDITEHMMRASLRWFYTQAIEKLSAR